MILCYQLFYFSIKQKISRKDRKENRSDAKAYRCVFASLRSLREIKKLNRITER